MHPIVIIGSGLAGYGLLRELRKRDKDVSVTVITADDGRAYAKPNLSNALASGKSPDQLSSQTAAQVEASLQARILTHTRVHTIDPVEKVVSTSQGDIAYGRLVLALGADPVPHGLSGSGLDGVYSVNDLDDYTRFRQALEGMHHVAILGGGLIGCEFANDLASTGHAVTVLHRGAWPLDRMLPEAIGRQLVASLAGSGVAWRFGRIAQTVDRTVSGLRITLDDGSSLEADVVLSSIGLSPRVALARACGLETRRGIVVNRTLQTSLPDIYAMGDCAEVEGHVLPFVQPLLIQARSLAATLTGERLAVAYPAMSVMVKTSLCPLAILPAAAGESGDWCVTDMPDGKLADYRDTSGKLLGFALSGGQVAQRSALASQVPALMPA